MFDAKIVQLSHPRPDFDLTPTLASEDFQLLQPAPEALGGVRGHLVKQKKADTHKTAILLHGKTFSGLLGLIRRASYRLLVTG